MAVMLYPRFPLSPGTVDNSLHERSVNASHETVSFWWHRFGPVFDTESRKRRIERMKSSRWRWYLDEVLVKINGEWHFRWRTVDHEGEVLESFVTATRDRQMTLRFFSESARKHGQPETIVTKKLRSGRVAPQLDIGAYARQETGRWLNNRTEDSPLLFRRRAGAILRFRRMRRLQKFTPVLASVCNHCHQYRGLWNRDQFILTARASR